MLARDDQTQHRGRETQELVPMMMKKKPVEFQASLLKKRMMRRRSLIEPEKMLSSSYLVVDVPSENVALVAVMFAQNLSCYCG